MRVLKVHNYYQQPGGEDLSYASEVRLLREHGHDVFEWRVHNRVVDRTPKLKLAAGTIWSGLARRKVAEKVRRWNIDIVHFDNTFPLLSPAVYGGARSAGAAVVQSIRNYRIMCIAAYLLRNGRVCEKCIGRLLPLAGLVHRCYRGSLAASTVCTLMQSVHHIRGTWTHDVDRFIALTQFGRDKAILAGLPADKVAVKPNFLTSPPAPGDGAGGYFLFVGRLSPEKGVATLLRAISQSDTDMSLKVVGNGPFLEIVRAATKSDPRIELMGHLPQDDVVELMRSARALVLPSEWYETFGRVVMEAMACGTPVIASDHGAMSELVEDGLNGWLFPVGDAKALADKMKQSLSLTETSYQAMRECARTEYEKKYTPEQNYSILMNIYSEAIDERMRSC